MPRRKSIDDCVETGSPLKVYVTESLRAAIDTLAKECGGVSRFFRDLVPLAWNIRHKKALIVPTEGGPFPAWVYTTAVEEDGSTHRAQITADNLVAIPHADLAHMREMNSYYESAWRLAMNDHFKLQSQIADLRQALSLLSLG